MNPVVKNPEEIVLLLLKNHELQLSLNIVVRYLHLHR